MNLSGAEYAALCRTIISILQDCATPLWVYGYLGMKLQNPDNFNPEKVLLRERTLTLASWPNKAKSDHHPSFIYSWFIKLLFLSHSNPKSCAVAYFEPKTYVLKPKLVFFSLLHVNLYQKNEHLFCSWKYEKFPSKVGYFSKITLLLRLLKWPKQ